MKEVAWPAPVLVAAAIHASGFVRIPAKSGLGGANGPPSSQRMVLDARKGRDRVDENSSCGTLSVSGRRLSVSVNKSEQTEPETQRTGPESEWNR